MALINPAPDILDSEQVAGHLASLASATRDEARGAFFG